MFAGSVTKLLTSRCGNKKYAADVGNNIYESLRLGAECASSICWEMPDSSCSLSLSSLSSPAHGECNLLHEQLHVDILFIDYINL